MRSATVRLVSHRVGSMLYRHEALNRRVERATDLLIDHGTIRTDRLEKELITLAELESAAHKQGFGSLAEIDRAILEPGGTICFIAKKPTTESARHDEILTRLDHISRRLAALGA